MPRVRITDRELRSKALKKAIARSQIDLGLKNDLETSQYLGEAQSTYSKHKKDPLKSYGFEDAAGLAKRMRFTANEILAIFGFQP